MKLRELIEFILEKYPVPMTCKEIWEKAVTDGTALKLGTTGKTPWDSIGAHVYTDIKVSGSESKFLQVSTRPSRFILKTNPKSADEIEKIVEADEIESLEIGERKGYNERDLHPLLVSFAYTSPHFNSSVKTIFHEKSLKKIKGANEWLHPDLVGYYFPFKAYQRETTSLQKTMSVSSARIYSFEMKKHLRFWNLRQCYFQAVSNSSWANEGYLVCLSIDSDPDFLNELLRLTNSFGIGIIRLNPMAIAESEILYQAKYRDVIDWDTLNRLVEDSPDFKDFISDFTEDLQLGKKKSTYDTPLNEEEIEEYILKKKIG